MSVKGSFSLTLLLLVLTLHLALWFISEFMYVRLIPLFPALLNLISFYTITSKSLLPKLKYINKYFVVKSINVLLNVLAVVFIFLAGFNNKVFMVFVYLISYLVLLIHFTYYIVKDRNTGESKS